MDRTGDAATGPGPRLHRRLNNEEVADRIALKIVSSVQLLATFPMSGRAGRFPGTRELVVANTPFLVAYAILQGTRFHRDTRRISRGAKAARGVLRLPG